MKGEKTGTMFQMQHIVRKLKTIRLRPGSKRDDRIKRNSPVPVDEIGYEASSLLSQAGHIKNKRKP
jgi:hypothetical protein